MGDGCTVGLSFWFRVSKVERDLFLLVHEDGVQTECA